MSDAKEINPLLRLFLELGPPVAFFIIYLRIRDAVIEIGGVEYSGFIIATVVFVPILLASILALWILTGKLSRMQLFVAFMVIFFGGLTAYFNDERFFKMKTTLVYGFFVVILGIGLLRGKSFLEYVMAEMIPMQEEGWMILTRRVTLGFAVLAVVNEIVWRTMSTDTWVKIETFGFPLAIFVFLWWQIAALQRFVIDESDAQ
ncbi:MAG: inner membrane-spanning protein YciB [Pseudomonadota bacterium]